MSDPKGCGLLPVSLKNFRRMAKVSREAADMNYDFGLTGRMAKAAVIPRRFPVSTISTLGGAALSAAQLNQLITDVGFSTEIDGKTYSADVTGSNGEYVATDGDLNGATASGTSLESAENNLTNRIDELV
jgi:hypothetical protein